MSHDSEGNKVGSLIGGLRAQARTLGLREDFLIDLFRDPDDWSFVVKSHALLETVTCSLLAIYLRREELESVLAQEIEMSARIEMTKVLGLTTSEDRKMMRALGTLRNKLVHNAKDTGFTFQDLLGNKDARQRFSETFGHTWSDPIPNSDPPTSRAEYVVANPKFAVFASVNKIAMDLMRQVSLRDTEAAIDALREAMVKDPR